MIDLTNLVDIIVKETGWKRMTSLYELNKEEQKIHDENTYKAGRIDMTKSYYVLATGHVINQYKKR